LREFFEKLWSLKTFSAEGNTRHVELRIVPVTIQPELASNAASRNGGYEPSDPAVAT